MSTHKSSKRYERQMNLQSLPDNFQDLLRNSKVLILGAGGLGCAASIYVAAAGVGKITVVDRDTINEPDLNRQILYTPEDIGKKKAKTCVERLHKFNLDIECVGLAKEINDKLLKDLVPKHDIVMDLCDNYSTRIKIAEACQKYGRQCVVAAVNGLEGFVMVTDKGSACFGCLYPDEVKLSVSPPRVLGAAAGNVGVLAAMRCILTLCNVGKVGVMYCLDFINMIIDEIEITKSTNCHVCCKA